MKSATRMDTSYSSPGCRSQSASLIQLPASSRIPLSDMVVAETDTAADGDTATDATSHSDRAAYVTC